MKQSLLFATATLLSTTIAWAGINYNGTALQENTQFTRSQIGTMSKNTMPETSGMACSRTTTGYLWAHGDENLGSDRKLVAIQPSGSLAMTVNISTPGTDRDDWEDICTGIYNGTNYIFVGAIGDNDLAYNDSYYILYFEEPAITSGTMTVTANYIRFGYPDNSAHNTETLMYDNIEQMFYVADKAASGPSKLYKLPFRTDYGTGVQRLTEVCALGSGSKFTTCTGGDITPDGQWMAIKNKTHILLWERQGSESLSTTALRAPQQIMAYETETQGESLAWDDATTFYTTSDNKKDTPIYKYVRANNSNSAVVTAITVNGVGLSGFSTSQLAYSIELPYGTTSMPTVAATTSNGATIAVNYPISLPGTVTIVCTSQNGQNSVTYTISVSVSTTPSTDATLASLSVNDTPIEGFSASVLAYSYQIAYTAALPVVTAVANDANASVQVTNVTAVDKTPTNSATVEVTAQDGSTTQVYTVTFTRMDAIKKINQILMSNSYSAYIPENDSAHIRAYYLAGESMPTIASYSVADGCTLTQSGSTVTLIGADDTSISYELLIEAVQPREFTAAELSLDGSESAWIKAPYGYDDTKKWKFSKTDTDYTREMNGKTHLELFLPACDTLVLFSMDKNERDINVYINGVQLGSKAKLIKAGIAFVVEQTAPFMFTVASAQSSGDGGIKALRMAKRGGASALKELADDEAPKTQKVLLDGQIYILKDGKYYSLTGQELK